MTNQRSSHSRGFPQKKIGKSESPICSCICHALSLWRLPCPSKIFACVFCRQRWVWRGYLPISILPPKTLGRWEEEAAPHESNTLGAAEDELRRYGRKKKYHTRWPIFRWLNSLSTVQGMCKDISGFLGIDPNSITYKFIATWMCFCWGDFSCNLATPSPSQK